MPEAFIPLREYLCPVVHVAEVAESVPVVEIVSAEERGELEELLSAVRRFRAQLTEAVERCTERLLRDIACEILGRELLLGSIEVTAIIRRAIDEQEELVAIHVHPDDAALLVETGATFISDSTLRRGDIVVELRDGSIDATLGVRLDRVLRGIAA